MVSKTGVVCEHNCLSLESAAVEMKAVAAQNPRVKDAVYHVVLSWPAGDSPSEDQAFDCGRRALQAVGMADHQYTFALHRDTDHVHLHIAANRVHPDSFAAVYPDRDFFKLDRLMRELELEHGWKHDKGPFAVFDREGRKVVDWASKDPTTKGKRPSQAADMERHGDAESLFSYVRGAPRAAAKKLLESPTADWPTLHAALARYTLEIRPKGRGFAVYDLGGTSAVPIKASDMDESFSKAHLEARLGNFEPRAPHEAVEVAAVYDKMRSPKRDPARREQQRQERADARRALYERYALYSSSFVPVRHDQDDVRRRYREIGEEARLRRMAARASTRSAAERRALYSVIAFETLRSRERLKSVVSTERNAIRMDRSSRKLRFREWVASEAAMGDQAAISQLRGWAYSERRTALALDALGSGGGVGGVGGAGGFRGAEPMDPTARALGDGTSFSVERDGTVVYRDASGAEMFRDHGRLVEFRAGAGPDAQRLAGQYAREKFGDDITLVGGAAAGVVPGHSQLENGVRESSASTPTGAPAALEPSAPRKSPRRPRMR